MKARYEKQQFNVRMRPELRDAALKLCDEAQLTRDGLAETVYASLFNSGDEVVQAKWKKVQRIAKGFHLTLSFDPANVQHVSLIA